MDKIEGYLLLDRNKGSETMQNQNTCKHLQATPIQPIHNNTINHKQHYNLIQRLRNGTN